MESKIAIIFKKDDPIQKEIFEVIKKANINYIILTNSSQFCLEYFNEFSGFFIIAIPLEELSAWEKVLIEDLNKYFKIYYYEKLNTLKYNYNLFSYFDFVIIGEQRTTNLLKLMNFLSENFWKKIPSNLVQEKNGKLSPLIQNILFIISISKEENISLEYLSKKLFVQKKEILNEIKNNLGLNFRQFIKRVKELKNKDSHF